MCLQASFLLSALSPNPVSLKGRSWAPNEKTQGQMHVKKQKHYSANKDLYSQSYGVSSCHIWMWELDHKEGWVLKNWCFWTAVLEEALENPLDYKEIKPVNPKGNQSLIFIGRTDAGAPIFWPPDVKSRLIGKDPDAGKDWTQEKKGMTEDETIGWHYWLNGHDLSKLWELVMACCSPWGRKELDTTERLNWTDGRHC